MQKQPFPVAEGSKKFEDWGEGVKNFRAGGGGVHYPITSHIGRKWVDFIWQPISIMGLLARV